MCGFQQICADIDLHFWGFLIDKTQIFRDVTGGAALNRRDRFTVFLGVITVEILPIPVLMVINNPWKLVDPELLVLG